MREELTKKAFKAVRWTTLNTVSQIGIQLLSLIILGRLLTPKAFGLMAMIMAVVEFVNVFARMGLTEAIIYKKDVTHNELSSLYFLNIFVGVFLSLLLFLCSDLIGRLYSEPELYSLVRLMSSLFVISSIGIVFESLLRKHLLFDTYSKINIFAYFIAFVSMVILAFWGAGVYALVIGQILLRSLKSIILLRIAIKRRWVPCLRFRPSEIMFYLKFGLYRVLAMSANQFNSRVDQLLIGIFLGPVALGFYSVAFRVIYLPIQKVNPILSQVAFPFFSKIQDQTDRLKRNYLKYINLILSLNAPVLAGITALAPILIPLILGDKWLPAVPVVRALAFYVFVRSIFNASGSLVMAKGKANWTFYWNMVMLIIIPGTSYLALKLSGSVIVVGLALGFVFFVFFFFHYALFLRNLLGSFFNEYLCTIGRPFLLSASMGLFTYLLSIPLLAWPKGFSTPVLITFGGIYYSVMTLVFNLGFVDELERVIPARLSKVISWLRMIAKPSYIA